MNASSTESEWKQAVLNSKVADSAWDRVICLFFFFFILLVAVSLFPTLASEKKSVCFFFKSHSIPCIWAVSRQQLLEGHTWLCMAGSGAARSYQLMFVVSCMPGVV